MGVPAAVPLGIRKGLKVKLQGWIKARVKPVEMVALVSTRRARPRRSKVVTARVGMIVQREKANNLVGFKTKPFGF
jgi:hypothetical protein